MKKLQKIVGEIFEKTFRYILKNCWVISKGFVKKEF